MNRERIWRWVFALVVSLLTIPADREAAAAAAPDTTVQAPDSIRVLELAPPVADVDAVDREIERERLKETLQRMGRREVAGRRSWERKKSGRVAMLSSALVPGLGQLYNGRRIKVAVMGGFAYSYAAQTWLNTKSAQRARAKRDQLLRGTTAYNLQNRLSEFHEEEARTWAWWFGAVWIIGILDAWVDAHLYDIRAYTPASQEQTGGVSQLIPQSTPTRYLTLTFEF